MSRTLSWLSAALALAVTQSNAATLIVAKSGGSYTTIQAGLNAANAGDTVLVRAGTYNERVSFPRSGSETAGSIVLMAAPGEAVIVDGTGLGGSIITVSNRSYVSIIGLEVCNSTSGMAIGIDINGSGSNILVRRCVVHDIRRPTANAHGIAVYGTSGTTAISRITIDSCEIRNCQLGQSESLVLNGNVTDFVVSNNVVHDNDNIGIDFIGFEGTASANDQARNGVCRGNRVYNISSASNPTYTDRCADGIYVDGGRDIIIERNIVDNCDIGIEVASEHAGRATSNIIVRNNFVSRSFQANILTGGYAANVGSATNITIVNNTLYQGNDAEIALQFNNNGVIIRNNIMYARSGNPYVDQWGSNNRAITVNNNLYYGASTSSAGSYTDAAAIFANPLLVSPYANLHIQAGSPARDRGVTLDTAVVGTLDIDGEPRVAGSAIDIGADEYTSTTVAPRHCYMLVPARAPTSGGYTRGFLVAGQLCPEAISCGAAHAVIRQSATAGQDQLELRGIGR